MKTFYLSNHRYVVTFIIKNEQATILCTRKQTDITDQPMPAPEHISLEAARTLFRSLKSQGYRDQSRLFAYHLQDHMADQPLFDFQLSPR